MLFIVDLYVYIHFLNWLSCNISLYMIYNGRDTTATSECIHTYERGHTNIFKKPCVYTCLLYNHKSSCMTIHYLHI